MKENCLYKTHTRIQIQQKIPKDTKYIKDTQNINLTNLRRI